MVVSSQGSHDIGREVADGAEPLGGESSVWTDAIPSSTRPSSTCA